MPRDACGDRLLEPFLDVGAATLRVTRCFQFSQVVLLQSCRTRPRCYDLHPQPQQPDRDVLRQPGQQNMQSAHRADSAFWALNQETLRSVMESVSRFHKPP
jgi:hypothetical protein